MNHPRIDRVPHRASFSAFNRIRLILLTTLVLFFKLETGRATDLDSSFTPAGSVASPDKAVVFELGTLADGHLAWRVNWQGTQVIAPSRAGILLDKNNTGANATISAPSLRSFVETFSTRHLQKSVSLAGTAAEFTVNIPGGPAWTFEVRLFNQGVAWRMRVPGSGSRHVAGESTDFVLPPASTVYANPDTVSYEGLHVKSAIEALQLRNDAGMPMTFELPGARFAALTESDVMHYSGMTLGTTGSNRLIGKFRDDPKGWGSLPPAHYTTVPFTHLLAGHIDFTPTTLNPAFFKGTTAALQLASAVVFSSPVLSWADDPALYLQSPVVDVIRDMPVEWDETRVLPPSAIGEVVLMARRHGQEWWIAAMNAGTARQFDVNLAALAGKEAVIDTFLEGKKPHEFNITRDAPIPESGLIHLAIKSGSGALIRVKPSPHPKITAPGHAKGPTEAFLMAYFVGDSVEENRMHLCWSLDGLKWTALNNDKPVVTSSMSTKAIRDPAILRKQDGTFVLMYTDSAWSVGQKPTCGFWDSPDLVNWSNQRIRALSSNPAVPAWGPEAIYDPATGKYIVLWCTARSDSLWFNTTTDFNTFSPEAQFFSPGYQVLENNIFQQGEYYYLIFKDERGKNSADTPYKALKVARFKSLTPGSFTTITDDYISPHLSEGPVICKAINADRWYLYYDMFMEGGVFKCSTTTNLDGNTSEWTQLPDNQFSMPKRVRNAHILEIDREELNRLRDVWDNGPNFAEGCKAIASSAMDGKPASNANDLNYNTCWSAAAGKGANEWLEINLGTNRTFNKTVIRQSNSARITGYKIQYHNGTEWLDAYTGGSMGNKVKIDTFPPVTSSRVRLLVTKVQPGAAVAEGETATCPQINEFDICLNTRKVTDQGK